MKRTTALNNVANLYIDRVGATPGTILEAEDRNNLQEEICNLLEGYDVTLNGANDEQLKELFQSKIDQGVRVADDVQFNDLTIADIVMSGNFSPMITPTDGIWSVSSDMVIPRGAYNIIIDTGSPNYININMIHDSIEYVFCYGDNSIQISQHGIFLFSDGISLKIHPVGTTPRTVRYKKF